MADLFTFRVFARNLLRGNRRKKYSFSYFIWDTNPDYTSNKPLLARLRRLGISTSSHITLWLIDQWNAVWVRSCETFFPQNRHTKLVLSPTSRNTISSFRSLKCVRFCITFNVLVERNLYKHNHWKSCSFVRPFLLLFLRILENYQQISPGAKQFFLMHM